MDDFSITINNDKDINTIFILFGPSGCGKDTLLQALTKELPNINIIVPHTTRPMRPGEINGKDYVFCDKHKFLNTEYIEFRSYSILSEDGTSHEWLYGTPLTSLSKYNIIIGTPEMYKNIDKEKYKNIFFVPIYINVDNNIRFQRIVNRENLKENPNYLELCRRYVADSKDFAPEQLDFVYAEYEQKDNPPSAFVNWMKAIFNI